MKSCKNHRVLVVIDPVGDRFMSRELGCRFGAVALLKAFTRIDLASVGVDAALTAVVPPRGEARGWLAGPRGIWWIARAERVLSHGQ